MSTYVFSSVLKRLKQYAKNTGVTAKSLNRHESLACSYKIH